MCNSRSIYKHFTYISLNQFFFVWVPQQKINRNCNPSQYYPHYILILEYTYATVYMEVISRDTLLGFFFCFVLFSNEYHWIRRHLLSSILMKSSQPYFMRTTLWVILLISTYTGNVSEEFVFPAYLLLDLAAWRIGVYFSMALFWGADSWTSMRRLEVTKHCLIRIKSAVL